MRFLLYIIATDSKQSQKLQRTQSWTNALFYMADHNKLLDFETWDMERPYPEPSDEEPRREEYLQACGSRAPPYRTGKDPMTIWQEARPAESECQESYEVYKALCRDQHKIERQGYDRDCLRVLQKAVRNCAKSPLHLRDPACANWMPTECSRRP